MTRLTSYEGLNALMTGASSGIGRLLALRMAAAGARVALVARREAELEELAEEIRAGGGEAVALVCDVGDREQALATAARAVEALGSIDVLVNNAGYGHHRRFLDWDLEDMERVMRVNFLGSLYFTKALLPAMVERGKGWLVFIASAAGRIAPADETAYAASKHAMVGLAGVAVAGGGGCRCPRAHRLSGRHSNAVLRRRGVGAAAGGGATTDGRTRGPGRGDHGRVGPGQARAHLSALDRLRLRRPGPGAVLLPWPAQEAHRQRRLVPPNSCSDAGF